MKNYTIGIHGCDDSTCFEMKMTKEQYEFMLQVAKQSEETSVYGCMPTLEVYGNEAE